MTGHHKSKLFSLLAVLPLSAVLGLGPALAAPAASHAKAPVKGATSISAGTIPTSKGVVDAVVLKQSSTFVGAVEMTISDNGIRFGMSKMGIVWVTFAPKWDGYAYNSEARSYLVRPHDEWKKKLFNLPTSKKSLEDVPKFTIKDTGKKETIEGYKCRVESLISPPGKKRKANEPSKPYVAGHIWVADDFPAPKEVGELMSNFVRVEVTKGIVLKAEMLKQGTYTEFKPVFETIKIAKKKCPPHFLKRQKITNWSAANCN